MDTATRTQLPSNLSYGELFRQTHDYLVRYTQTQGIAAQDAEDCVSRLFLAMIEKDVMAGFDPELITEHDGVLRRTSARALIMALYRKYLMGYREKLETERYREPLVCDRLLKDTDTPWVEANSPQVEPEDPFEPGPIEAIRVLLDPDLEKVFQECLDSADSGKVDFPAVARKLHVRKPVLDLKIRYIKSKAREALV